MDENRPQALGSHVASEALDVGRGRVRRAPGLGAPDEDLERLGTNFERSGDSTLDSAVDVGSDARHTSPERDVFRALHSSLKRRRAPALIYSTLSTAC